MISTAIRASGPTTMAEVPFDSRQKRMPPMGLADIVARATEAMDDVLDILIETSVPP